MANISTRQELRPNGRLSTLIDGTKMPIWRLTSVDGVDGGT